MNGVLGVLAYLVALNPARTRLGLPESSSGSRRFGIAAMGASLGALALVLVAAGSGAMLRAFAISPETFRIAAGLVLVVGAARMMVIEVPGDEPVPDGWAAAVWPVAFPRVLTAEMIMLVVTTAASGSVGSVLPGLAVATGSLLGLSRLDLGETQRRVLVAVGRISAALLVLIGVWLALQGVREV